MSKTKKFVKQRRYFYRAFVATALLANGVFQFIAPVLAEGTTAGTSISNEATATYQDPNDTNTTINATSNKVTVTVAEVAGITVTPVTVIDNNGGTVGGGDLLYYTYSVKNVGNDPTKFQIPNTATITGGPGAVSADLEYSTDGGTTWISANPTAPGAGITPSVPVDGSVLVRVPVTVQPGAVINDIITVVLGNTPTTNNGQNLPRDPDIRDIYTVDNADGSSGEVTGTPANGVREASATDEIKVGTVAPTLKSFALATLLKTRGAYLTNATAEITDDKVSYDLSLRVESNDVTGQGITPAPLIGKSINVDSGTETRILVSDAIPAGTVLAATPTPPSGWDAVYTTDAVSTTANLAQWKRFSTTPLANAAALATVKRVGFISKASITAINPGQTVSGFSIQLAITGSPTTLTINNIGQLFGATPVPANSPVGTLPVPVYDESGDPNPSNYEGLLDNMTPPASTTPVNGVPTVLGTVDDGYVDVPATPETGTDPTGNNTGTGLGGEANTFTLKAAVPVDLLNGPQNTPDAVGPTSNNDDFTNKSSFVDPNKTFGDTIDPLPVVFINTVKNTGTATSNISLLPTPVATGTYDDALPTGTLVTINYNSLSKLYVWDGTNFLYDADGSAGTTGDRSAIDATSKYFTIPVLNNAIQSYGVEVNLPAGTKLSTETLKGFPAGVTAFVDDATPGLGSETVKNTTIDRVYTGFLKVVKLSRVLKGVGPDVGLGQDDFETTPPTAGGFDPGTGATVFRTPAVGNIVEYQIRYTNISAPQSGTGNAILNADKIVITEDGTKSPSNWALDNDSNGGIDTSNIVGTAKDSGTSTIQFFIGNPATTSGVDQTGSTVNSDVTKYVNTVTGQVAPGVQRTFTIQRKVN
jgi:hypothetical protein